MMSHASDYFHNDNNGDCSWEAMENKPFFEQLKEKYLNASDYAPFKPLMDGR